MDIVLFYLFIFVCAPVEEKSSDLAPEKVIEAACEEAVDVDTRRN